MCVCVCVYTYTHICCCSGTKLCPTLCDPMDCRLPCPPPSPRLCPNSCPLSQWCYLIISSSATPFSFCLQSFPASGSFPMSQLFVSHGQSIGDSKLQSIGASASVLPMNIQGWFPLGLTGLTSLQSKGLSTYILIYTPTLGKYATSSIWPVVAKLHSGAAVPFYAPSQ